MHSKAHPRKGPKHVSMHAFLNESQWHPECLGHISRYIPPMQCQFKKKGKYTQHSKDEHPALDRLGHTTMQQTTQAAQAHVTLISSRLAKKLPTVVKAA